MNFSGTATTLKSQVNLYTDQPVTAIDIANPTNSRYTYSLWVFINNFTGTNSPHVGYENNHTLFYVKNTAASGCQNHIRLYLDNVKSTLVCDFGFASDVDSATKYSTAPPDNRTSSIIITQNFPLQKWTYITISVDNQYVDCYIDGKLVKSSIMLATDGSYPLPPSKSNTLNVGCSLITSSSGNSKDNCFDVIISKFIRDTIPQDPQTVWNYYLQGNGTSTILPSNYGLSVNVSKNNSLQNIYKIW